jgi:hypothetical protein
MKAALLLLLSELAVIFVLVSVVHALAGMSPVVQAKSNTHSHLAVLRGYADGVREAV